MSLADHLHPEVRLIREHAAGLLALEKPSGIRSHPNDGGVADEGALLTLPYDEAAEAYLDGGARYFLLNRLDAPTSGLILLATDAQVAAEVKARFAGRDVQKTYLAVVKGRLARPQERWSDKLLTQTRQGQLRTITSPRGEPALCEARQLKQSQTQPLLSLIELQPHTGRTHQLRVQCASRHLPIVGDATYGDFRYNREFAKKYGEKRLLLHAAAVKLEFKAGGKAHHFEAQCAMPTAMQVPFMK
ncbi:MAG: RNA pseudouridine synthase [Verrucomicrobiota bacterium JB022]|nr:RNA pseudouridine synthase [Verrucomicrobiota bacterium JB022]